MTWRERIQAARKRGYFNAEDRNVWADCDTCLVGEAVTRAGLSRTTYNAIGASQEAILEAILTNDFDEVDRILDGIEDRMLQLKREAQ